VDDDVVIKDCIDGWCWAGFDPMPAQRAQVPQQSAPERAVQKLVELSVELHKLAAAEKLWADETTRFELHQCVATFNSLQQAQVGMAIAGCKLMIYLRTTGLLNVKPSR